MLRHLHERLVVAANFLHMHIELGIDVRFQCAIALSIGCPRAIEQSGSVLECRLIFDTSRRSTAMTMTGFQNVRILLQ